MKSNPSIKEQLRDVHRQLFRAGELFEGATDLKDVAVDQATEAILQIIESEVIGEDEHDSDPDYSGYEAECDNLAMNALRELQREKLSQSMREMV